jgi:hypothetical protein
MLPILNTQQISYVSGTISTVYGLNPINKTRPYLYSVSLWIRENTKKDLEYLYKIKNDA